MQINTKIELKDLLGKPLEASKDVILTLGLALSNILISAEEGGKMKLFILAKKFFEEKAVDLDNSDLALVKNIVGKTKIYNALVAGQVELILEDLKDVKKKT